MTASSAASERTSELVQAATHGRWHFSGGTRDPRAAVEIAARRGKAGMSQRMVLSMGLASWCGGLEVLDARRGEGGRGDAGGRQVRPLDGPFFGQGLGQFLVHGGR